MRKIYNPQNKESFWRAYASVLAKLYTKENIKQKMNE